MAIGGFAAMRALSTRNDSLRRPRVLLIRIGTALFWPKGLEFLFWKVWSMQRKGASILCELTGYGVSSDAYHMTSPAPDGNGAARAIQMAFNDAG